MNQFTSETHPLCKREPGGDLTITTAAANKGAGENNLPQRPPPNLSTTTANKISEDLQIGNCAGRKLIFHVIVCRQVMERKRKMKFNLMSPQQMLLHMRNKAKNKKPFRTKMFPVRRLSAGTHQRQATGTESPNYSK